MPTNVVARTQDCSVTLALRSMNCGRKATKKTMLFGLRAVTTYVFANSLHREVGTDGAAASADAIPAWTSLAPTYIRYAPPAHFTTVNQKAEMDSSAPNPNSEARTAVESPNATARTSGTFARRPCATE